MKAAPSETVIGNARIVLADRVIDRGWVAFADGKVAEVGEGNPAAIDHAICQHNLGIADDGFRHP